MLGKPSNKKRWKSAPNYELLPERWGRGGHIFKMVPKPIGSPIGQRIGRAPGSYWGQNGHPIGSPIGSTPKSNTCTLPFNVSFILNC